MATFTVVTAVCTLYFSMQTATASRPGSSASTRPTPAISQRKKAASTPPKSHASVADDNDERRMALTDPDAFDYLTLPS